MKAAQWIISSALVTALAGCGAEKIESWSSMLTDGLWLPSRMELGVPGTVPLLPK